MREDFDFLVSPSKCDISVGQALESGNISNLSEPLKSALKKSHSKLRAMLLDAAQLSGDPSQATKKANKAALFAKDLAKRRKGVIGGDHPAHPRAPSDRLKKRHRFNAHFS